MRWSNASSPYRNSSGSGWLTECPCPWGLVHLYQVSSTGPGAKFPFAEYTMNIEAVKEITKSINRTSKRTIKSRQKRQNTASENEEIQIYSEKLHIVKKVEFELTDLFGNEIEKVIVSNCINKCKHEFSCHVFAQLKNEHCLNNEELIQTIQLHLNRKHDLKCGLIILLQPDTFASFLADNGKIARFRFLEEFQQTCLPERIIFAYRLPDLTTKPEVDIPETIPPCEEYHINDNKPSAPLHWKNFNLLQEWSLDVPLSVQILLESFVNQKSLDRLSLNVICYIKYLLTAGSADTRLPNFLSDGCLKKSVSGEIEFELGEEAHVEDINSMILVPSNVLLEKNLAKQTRKKKTSKRKQNETPQKGRPKKVQNRTSTPKKN
ncbi:unnamed protein product [Mytilus coruscus]|uniref:Uncharacterized protein n=1 Tax=Mytilus coruscus TaxID=42192 RepID=A0A6J8BDV7_MYTCO|nr:unnamed protein product [Mytilus coruscus]